MVGSHDLMQTAAALQSRECGGIGPHLESFRMRQSRVLVDPKQEEARARLRILEETRDGFRIADEDLRLRGPGEVLGTMQSGLPDLAFADLLGDTRLVEEARKLAEAMLEDAHS